MHLKRKTMPKDWPIPKTGTKYLALAEHNQKDAIPLMIVMRDMLNKVKTKKELKKLLNEKKVLINGKIVRESNYPVSLFDSLSFSGMNHHYRLVLDGKRLKVEEAQGKKAELRIYKIIGKTKLAGNKIQLNLSNGKNIISNEKAATGDFVMLNNADNKILKTIQLKKDTSVIAIKGKHKGKQGAIHEIIQVGENEIVVLKTKEGEIKINRENVFAKEQD